jgi:SAM-dependent methyltransferase
MASAKLSPSQDRAAPPVKAMNNLYLQAQRLWRVTPGPLKALVRRLPALNSTKKCIANLSGQVDPHNRIYNDTYYVVIEKHAQMAQRAVAQSILTDFQPGSVLDVGCGTGAFLAELQARGVQVMGLEHSEAALVICRRKGLRVVDCDLENDAFALREVFDVAVSTEVAEHLPASCADRYVDLLCQAAPWIVFTAATPGQAGQDHVNEQPNDYWIARFAARGCRFDEERALQWRTDWRRQSVPDFYFKNLMIFQRVPYVGGAR